jgi:hypothetical protein
MVNLSNTPFSGTVEAPAGNWRAVDLVFGPARETALPSVSLDAFGARIFQQ